MEAQQEIERLNQVSQLLVDTKELMKTIDEMYYKKGFDVMEQYKEIQETDNKFRKCRQLLIKNMDRLKEQLTTNFNLVLALSVHMSVMTKELEKLNDIKLDYEDITTHTEQLIIKEDDKPIKKQKFCDDRYNCDHQYCNDNYKGVGVLTDSDSSTETED